MEKILNRLDFEKILTIIALVGSIILVGLAYGIFFI